jgi:hypothetical protein
VDFGFADHTVAHANRRTSFAFSPSGRSVKFAEAGNLSNARSARDRLDIREVVQNGEIHFVMIAIA